MAAIAQLTPYLNRLVILLQQNAKAKLEIHCKNRQLSVNFLHEIGSVEETPSKVSSTYSDVLKKNSKINRLIKRAAERAEQSKTKIQVAEKASEEKYLAEIGTKCESEQDNHEAAQANHKVAHQTAKIKCDDDVEIQFKEEKNQSNRFSRKRKKLEIIMKKLMKGKTIVKMKPTTKLKLNKKKIKIPGLIKTSHLKDNQRFKKGQQ